MAYWNLKVILVDLDRLKRPRKCRATRVWLLPQALNCRVGYGWRWADSCGKSPGLLIILSTIAEAGWISVHCKNFPRKSTTISSVPPRVRPCWRQWLGPSYSTYACWLWGVEYTHNSWQWLISSTMVSQWIKTQFCRVLQQSSRSSPLNLSFGLCIDHGKNSRFSFSKRVLSVIADSSNPLHFWIAETMHHNLYLCQLAAIYSVLGIWAAHRQYKRLYQPRCPLASLTTRPMN